MAGQQLSTNTFTTAKWIVSPTLSNGTHTTLGGALAAASNGDTIFIRPNVIAYTEDNTITKSVNIVAYDGDGIEGNVIINGNNTVSSAVSVTFSGVQLQTNSAAFLTVSGGSASVINLYGCYLNCLNSTGIIYSSSSSSSSITLTNCIGNIGTTGITFVTATSAGGMTFNYCTITNTGSSTTASSNSAGGGIGIFGCTFQFPMSTTSTGTWSGLFSRFQTLTNTTILTTAGSGSGGFTKCNFASGSAACVSIGTGTTLDLIDCTLTSTATNIITGSGGLRYSNITIGDSGNSGINIPIGNQVANNTITGSTLFLTASGTTGTATNNTITVYEEGTWTPTLIGASSAGSTSYTTQVGYYTKIGNMVTLYGKIVITAATGTGDATLGGFPFTIKNQANFSPDGVITFSGNGWTWPASRTMLTIEGTLNTTTAVIVGTASASVNSNLQMANSAANLRFTISYQV